MNHRILSLFVVESYFISYLSTFLKMYLSLIYFLFSYLCFFSLLNKYLHNTIKIMNQSKSPNLHKWLSGGNSLHIHSSVHPFFLIWWAKSISNHHPTHLFFRETLSNLFEDESYLKKLHEIYLLVPISQKFHLEVIL